MTSSSNWYPILHYLIAKCQAPKVEQSFLCPHYYQSRKGGAWHFFWWVGPQVCVPLRDRGSQWRKKGVFLLCEGELMGSLKYRNKKRRPSWRQTELRCTSSRVRERVEKPPKVKLFHSLRSAFWLLLSLFFEGSVSHHPYLPVSFHVTDFSILHWNLFWVVYKGAQWYLPSQRIWLPCYMCSGNSFFLLHKDILYWNFLQWLVIDCSVGVNLSIYL